MQILYIIISVSMLIYFIFFRKRADLFTFAYLSAFIYFLPGLFGYSIYPGRFKIDLDYRAYLVFLIVLFSLFIFSHINQSLDIKFKVSYVLKEANYIPIITTVMSTLIMFYYIISLNVILLESKAVLMPYLGLPFLFFRYAVPLSFILGIIQKRKLIVYLSLVSLVFSFLIGFRGPTIVTALALFIIYIKKVGLTKKLINFKLIAFSIPFVVLIVNGKVFYGTFKNEGFLSAAGTLFNYDVFQDSLSRLEPFSIQTILNEILKTNYMLPKDYIKDLLYEFTLVPNLYLDETSSFNYHFQNDLFGSVEYGMAYNIWAELYAINGFFSLILGVIIFSLIIMILDNLLEYPNRLVQTILAVSSVYWIFLVHRYSISIELSHQRHIIITVILALIASILMNIILKRK